MVSKETVDDAVWAMTWLYPTAVFVAAWVGFWTLAPLSRWSGVLFGGKLPVEKNRRKTVRSSKDRATFEP